jgi:nucleotide-binding universal stress UspA family protein
MEDAAVQEAHKACERTLNELEAFHADRVVIAGRSIADALIAYVESNPVDAIVVGRRSHSLSRHLMGSISGELASHSPTPVWVIP